MNAEETLEYLRGSWRVRRTIDDRISGDRGTFEGWANYRSVASEALALRFEERGEVSFGSYRGTAHRELELVAASSTLITVNFVDGHHFIDLDFEEGASRDVHLCNADRYEITMRVRSNDSLEEQWVVRGPAKDYVARTTLERMTP